MNREILFRGQIRKFGEKVNMMGEKLPGKWVYGGIFYGIGDFSIIYGWKSKDGHTGDKLEKFVVYSDTVGQFTGLTDKNGVKIFEGDIIAYEDGAPGQFECNDNIIVNYGEVIFCEGEFCFTNSVVACMDDLRNGNGTLECEVIGNIHDNPELLEGA